MMMMMTIDCFSIVPCSAYVLKMTLYSERTDVSESQPDDREWKEVLKYESLSEMRIRG